MSELVTGMATAQVGFYGKLPGRADFVVRGLPESFLTPLGDWIERSVSAARAAFGTGWSEAYLTSPVWHFALPPGLAGRQPAAGAMAPSTDRAGREFPFVVAACASSDLPAATLAAATASWVALAAELAAAAVVRDLDPAQIQTRIADLTRVWPDTLPGLTRPVGDRTGWRLPGQGNLVGALAPLLDHASGAFTRPSLWWSDGSAHVEPCTMLCDGLPDAARFTAMIDGRWGK